MSYLADRLAEVELFRGLDEDTRERLVAAGATITFRPGATIVEQGKSDRSLFLLLEGSAKTLLVALSQRIRRLEEERGDTTA